MNRSPDSTRMVALLCATATAGYICRVNISTAAPLLMKEFSLSQVAMGRVFSAFLLGYALFQVPAGMLADKWGTKKILMTAAWLWVFFTIIESGIGWGPLSLSAGTTLIVFMIARFLQGITASPTYPASARGVSKWIPVALQGRANGIVIASVGLGSAIAPPMVSYCMVHWGWRMAMLVTAIPVTIIAITWKRTREPRAGVTENNIDTIVSVQPTAPSSKLASRGFVLLSISYTLQGYVGYIFVSWFYLYLVQVRHFSLLAGAWVSSLPWVLSIISMPLGGYIADQLQSKHIAGRWGVRLVPITGMALSGILISIGAHTGNAILAAIALAFATAFVLCVEGPFWTVMTRFAGTNSGRAGGIMNMGSNLGGLISPMLTPLLAEKIGWENALHVSAVLAIIAAVVWCWISPPNLIRAIPEAEVNIIKN